MLQNLVSNAIDYSPQNTAVSINLEKIDSASLSSRLGKTAAGTASVSAMNLAPNGSPQADDFLIISIFNKGPVIPLDEQRHLFERFYRGESGKKMKAEGTGLGLYIIKIIIEEVGGSIGFESAKDKDTVFWFTIPLKANDK